MTRVYTLTMEITDEQAAAFTAECGRNAIESHDVNGVDIQNVYIELFDEMRKALKGNERYDRCHRGPNRAVDDPTYRDQPEPDQFLNEEDDRYESID